VVAIGGADTVSVALGARVKQMIRDRRMLTAEQAESFTRTSETGPRAANRR